jgi:hypothetical protein
MMVWWGSVTSALRLHFDTSSSSVQASSMHRAQGPWLSHLRVIGCWILRTIYSTAKLSEIISGAKNLVVASILKSIA